MTNEIFGRLMLIILLFFMQGSILYADDIFKHDGNFDRINNESEKQGDNTPLPIFFYQRYISPALGDRCPMYPSCSQYSREAIKKHGIILGIVMTCDRLIRCGRDEIQLAPAVFIENEKYVYDPVDENDFWHNK